MRQIFGDVRWELKALVFFVGTLTFVVVGPFGTYEDLTFSERIVFWFAVMTAVGFFMHICMTLTLRSAALANWPRLACVALGAMVAAIPGAAIVEFINEVFRPSGVRFSTLVRIWMQVTLVGTVIGAVEYIDWRGQTKEIVEDAPQMTRFHKRLPPAIGHDIISFTVQDHYVEVSTTQGREMILLRFSDALDEIGPDLGLRLHRSHWAAKRHIEGLEKSGNRHMAKLSDGRSLPVSGTYSADLRTLLAGR